LINFLFAFGKKMIQAPIISVGHVFIDVILDLEVIISKRVINNCKHVM